MHTMGIITLFQWYFAGREFIQKGKKKKKGIHKGDSPEKKYI
jgi:hypothetical protein